MKWIGRPLVYVSSVQGRQAALALIVFANLIALILFLFRKKVVAASPLAVTVYKDLYVEALVVKESQERELHLFKEIFEESQIDPMIKEKEMAELLSIMRLPQRCPL